jgi:hypothetical protein
MLDEKGMRRIPGNPPIEVEGIVKDNGAMLNKRETWF